MMFAGMMAVCRQLCQIPVQGKRWPHQGSCMTKPSCFACNKDTTMFGL